MTTALIFGIAFLFMALIMLAVIITLYLGGKTSVEGFIIMFLALFMAILFSAGLFSNHFEEVKKQEIEIILKQHELKNK
jgi:apolipoprotein N-acyltransferase